jgi:hypothetical protein
MGQLPARRLSCVVCGCLGLALFASFLLTTWVEDEHNPSTDTETQRS